jgi:hypothetical protein
MSSKWKHKKRGEKKGGSEKKTKPKAFRETAQTACGRHWKAGQRRTPQQMKNRWNHQ